MSVPARVRLTAVPLALSLAVGACTRNESPTVGHPSGSTPSPSATAPPSPEPVQERLIVGDAAKVLKAICDVPSPKPEDDAKPEASTPAVIAVVEDQIEKVRELEFEHPVPVEALTQQQLVDQLRKEFDKSFPEDLARRETLSFQTMGLLPAGIDLRAALEDFLSSQVIGFYVPETGKLVFIGSDSPDALERITLAHELTHALDDQHFDLARTDALAKKCRDEAGEAATAVIEGSAQLFSLRWAQANFSPEDIASLADIELPSTEGVPPFILKYEEWPYTAGMSFLSRLSSTGGVEAVNDVLRHFPTTTEQILHADRFPSDQPTPLDVVDLPASAFPDWKDLDVGEVGEAFLSVMLGLQIDQTDAADAAAGWDGGLYRAWSKGSKVAVVMATAWDTPEDAHEFADAMNEYIANAGLTGEASSSADRARVLFASDEGTLSTLRAAA